MPVPPLPLDVVSLIADNIKRSGLKDAKRRDAGVALALHLSFDLLEAHKAFRLPRPLPKLRLQSFEYWPTFLDESRPLFPFLPNEPSLLAHVFLAPDLPTLRSLILHLDNRDRAFFDRILLCPNLHTLNLHLWYEEPAQALNRIISYTSQSSSLTFLNIRYYKPDHTPVPLMRLSTFPDLSDILRSLPSQLAAMSFDGFSIPLAELPPLDERKRIRAEARVDVLARVGGQGTNEPLTLVRGTGTTTWHRRDLGVDFSESEDEEDG
ncbi:hypothetical protein JCM11251_005409 [Rhodosporidiobolus azoricus]